MEMISSFIWFVSGAVLALVIKFLINYREDIKSTEKLVVNLFYLVQGITSEINAAIYFKHEALKATEISDLVVKKIIRDDIEQFEVWKKNIIQFLLTSMPERYYTYLKYKFNSPDEIISHFSQEANKRKVKK